MTKTRMDENKTNRTPEFVSNDAARIFRGIKLRVLRWYPNAAHDDPEMNRASDALVDWIMARDDLTVAEQADLVETMSDSEARKIIIEGSQKAKAEETAKESPPKARQTTKPEKLKTVPEKPEKAPEKHPEARQTATQAAPKAKAKAKPTGPSKARLENEQHWTDRMKGNRVYETAKMFEGITDEVVQGHRPAAYLCGPAGVGKTYHAEQSFKGHRVRWRLASPISAAAMAEALMSRK